MHNLHKTLFLIVLQLLMCSAALAQGGRGRNSREPWEWTDDERIAARLDPAQMRERADAFARRERNHPNDATESEESSPRDVIDGSRNPELFLPYELFNWLMNGVVTEDPKARDLWRLSLGSRLRGTGVDEASFWQQLEQVVAGYTRVQSEQDQIAEEGARTSDVGKRRSLRKKQESFGLVLCRARHEALEAARAHFGRETFDRILYDGVAASGLTSSAVHTPGRDEAAGLRYVAGGCK